MGKNNSAICPECNEKNNPAFVKCWKCGADLKVISVEQSASYVLQWVEAKMESLGGSRRVPLEGYFVTVMYALGGLCKKQRQAPSQEVVKPIDYDDSTLFELGCFLFTLIDLWIFAHHEQLRPKICSSFIKQFDDLFSHALNINAAAVHVLLQRRSAKYGEIARNEKLWNEETFSLLSQLIMCSKKGQIFEGNDYDKLPLNLDAINDHLIKREMMLFLECLFPTIIEATKVLCHSIVGEGRGK